MLYILAACVAGLAACDRQTGPARGGKLGIAVSILPQAFLAERVGGEHVAVTVLVGPGQSPHAYEPTPKQMASLADARVLLTIGVPFEKQLLPKLQAGHERLRVVDTRKGISLRTMACRHDDHDHDHAHGEADPHVWLSPRNAKTLAANAAAALKELDPAHAADYDANLKSLHADLDALDARIAKVLAPLKGQTLFVYHPAFGYFADAYGLRQEPVEVEGKEPTARQLAALIDEAKRDGVRVIFVQKQFSVQSASALAEAIGGAVVAVDPLAYDYVANLESLADQVAEALRKER
jgi:zinc transport system substrate-binding protein